MSTFVPTLIRQIYMKSSIGRDVRARDPTGRIMSGLDNLSWIELGRANMDVMGITMELLRSFLWKRYWVEDMQTVMLSPGVSTMRRRRPRRTVQASLVSKWEMSAVGGGGGKGKGEKSLQFADRTWNGGRTFEGTVLRGCGSWQPNVGAIADKKEGEETARERGKCWVEQDWEGLSLPTSYGLTFWDWNVRPLFVMYLHSLLGRATLK